MRRKFWLLVVDLIMVALATVGALLLRDNFEIWPARLRDLVPYLGVTLAIYCIVAPILGVNRSIWRLSTTADNGTVLLAALLTVAGSLAACFLVNRLDGVPRGLPAIQLLLMAAALVSLRLLARERQLRRSASTARPVAGATQPETIIVVGLNRITELYLQSLAEFAPGTIAVAGILGHNDNHTGRLVHQHKILGMPEDIANILRELEVRGIIVDRIVVTARFDRLAEAARAALLDVEQTSSIPLEFVSEWVAGRKKAGTATDEKPIADDDSFPMLSPHETREIVNRPHWQLKRILDVLGAVVLIVATAPVQMAVALIVALDVGFPMFFWQQRPGIGGRPFRLYKFRTMSSSHDASGRRRADADRLSALGQILRRTRLDELPQLYNILIGDMSFIGPRPLLPVDQPAGYPGRLLVRPGLTGWAQIMGGRIVGADDKGALDLWYVRNASLALDLQILLRTVPMLVAGDRVNASSINDAWSELRTAPVLEPQSAGSFIRDLHVVRARD